MISGGIRGKIHNGLKKTGMLSMSRKLRTGMKKLSGKIVHIPVKHACAKLRLGSDAGSWTICPDKINADSVVYSFGLGDDISFDQEIIKKFGCRVYGADPTPKSIEYLQSIDLPANFNYQQIAIADYNGEIELFFPANEAHVSLTSGDDGRRNGKSEKFICKTIEAFMNDYGHKHIDILKMDIKGPEFSIIPQLLNDGVSFTQLVLEFSPQCVENGKARLKQVLSLLESHGYYVFHVADSGVDVSIIKR